MKSFITSGPGCDPNQDFRSVTQLETSNGRVVAITFH